MNKSIILFESFLFDRFCLRFLINNIIKSSFWKDYA